MPACGGKASRCWRLRVCRLVSGRWRGCPIALRAVAVHRDPVVSRTLPPVVKSPETTSVERGRATAARFLGGFPRSVIAWRLMSNGWWPTLNPGACAGRHGRGFDRGDGRGSRVRRSQGSPVRIRRVHGDRAQARSSTGAGKTPEQIVAIADALVGSGKRGFSSRDLTREKATAVEGPHARESSVARVFPRRAFGRHRRFPEPDGDGLVVVASAGTSDLPVADEARAHGSLPR